MTTAPPEVPVILASISTIAMTLEEQYLTLMDAAERAPDAWAHKKFVQEAENVLMLMNGQILQNKQDFNSSPS